VLVRDRPEANTPEPDDRMSDRFEHAPDLAVAPL
jgi:hypothetical protein